MQRQEILYRPDKRFHFVLTEAALRMRLCPPEVMLGQLDRLVSFSALPNVRLGIIGFRTRYATSPWHGFWLYDQDRVMVETYSAALTLTQPQEIELYGRVFDELAAVASYGRAARAIINAVGEELAAEMPEEDGAPLPGIAHPKLVSSNTEKLSGLAATLLLRSQESVYFDADDWGRGPGEHYRSPLEPTQITRLPDRAREVVEYRKSGLSLNHIQGCPLDCAYCIRHTYGLWDQRLPRALMGDAEAVEQLVSHRYFQADLTPIQLFNRATDPFLPAVRPHTFAVLEDLDQRGLTNHVLVITRCPMKAKDVERLNALKNLKVTLLVTYSGIEDSRDRAVPLNGRRQLAGIHERDHATPLPDGAVLASAGAGPERLARAPRPSL